MTTTPSQFDDIDSQIHINNTQDWKALLPFKAFICSLLDDVPPAGDPRYKQNVDLFEDGVNAVNMKNVVIRFDPLEYPVNGLWAKDGGGYKLITAISSVSHKTCGCGLISVGAKQKGMNKPRYLYCCASRMYVENEKKAGGPQQKVSFHSDRSNSRGPGGLKMQKRTTTGRPLSLDNTCKVHLVLHVDGHTFFLKCGIGGVSTHTRHAKIDADQRPTRACFVQEEIIVYQKEFAISNLLPGQTSVAVNKKFGIGLSRRQVAYHQGLSKYASSLADAKELEEVGTALSPIDQFIAMLKKKGASYCAIYHRKEGSALELPKPKKARKSSNDVTVVANAAPDDLLWMETATSNHPEPMSLIVGVTDNLGNDLLKYARDSRVAVNADDDQDVMIAFVWVLPEGKRLFRAFPEVNFIDGTHKTNNENRPLITGGIRDSDGKVSVVYRAFVPNERAWLFRWLFQVALPSLLGKAYCELVQLQITDGNSQETSQLDLAGNIIFPNSKRRRCGWHIVEKGWQRHLRGVLVKSDATTHVTSVIKRWLYSLMKGVETEVEYKISKALLLAYISSSAVQTVTGSIGSDRIMAFLRNNVFPHEDNFAAHHYHYRRSFKEYSNTPLEGTNNGLKYNLQSVKPSMDLANAGKVMADQDITKFASNKRRAANNFYQTPLYTSTPTSRHLKPVAEEMLNQQCALIESFASIWISNTTWVVAFGVEQNKSISSSGLPPIFERLRTVEENEEGQIHCSCGHLERNGVPCRHISHVLHKYGNNFKGFSHHDVAIRFWSSYHKFVAIHDPATLNESELDIRTKLLGAKCTQPLGALSIQGGLRPYEGVPQYEVGMKCSNKWHSMDTTTAVNYFTSRLNQEVSIANYTASEVEAAIAKMAVTFGQAAGMTQETYNASDDDSASDIQFQEMNNANFDTWKASRQTNGKELNAHDILASRLKELASVYENMPDQLAPLTVILDEYLQKGKAMNAMLLPKPTGWIISSTIPNGKIQRKHKKQYNYL